MTTTATTVLNIARSQLGYREGRNNSTKFGAWYQWQGVSWCAQFQSWVFAQADALGLVYGKHAYCPWWVRDFESHGRFHSWQTAPQRGDIVFYNWSGNHGLADHVGIVEAYDATHHVVTSIEGNTTSGIAGNQSDGGGVYRRRRNTLYVAGYGRPAYAPERNVTPLPVSRSGSRRPPLLVDSCWGRMTTRAVQAWCGITQDGVAGRVTHKALQRKLGVKADGVWGRETIRALQWVVGARQDGVLGPVTVAAFQRFLNRHV